MKRIRRVKSFVYNHRFEIIAAAGFVAGSAVTHRLVSPQTREAWCHMTVNQAQQLLNDPEKCVTFTFDVPKDIVNVIVDPSQ
jgi:hypothetical protein